MEFTQSFNGFLEGKHIAAYTLVGKGGMRAVVSNYGAKILSLLVPTPTPAGERDDVVLGFSSLEEWLTQETYFNAVIGRVSNRI